MKIRIITSTVLLMAWSLSTFADPAQRKPPLIKQASKAERTATRIEFVRDVQPIFAKHCYSCHGTKKQKSGFRLDVKSVALKGGDSSAPNVVPGNSSKSPLIQFVLGEDEEMLMPPKGKRLSTTEIATLSKWINQGAEWPDGVDKVKLKDLTNHWAFKPVGKVTPPATKNTGWPRNDVDRFILAALEAKKLTPSKQSKRATWLRRVYLNLTGLTPTPQQIETFLGDIKPDAERRVVDTLLNSSRYGERWAQHWLDIVRYADTHGFEVNTPRNNAWPYRDYLIRSFNEDKPYDQFIREQLVGDAMQADEATGFLVASAVLLPGQIGKDDASKRLARQDAIDEMIVGTSSAFLGLTIGCARCHDHKFDPISHRDYYAMQAFFAGVDYGDRPINSPSRQQKLAKAATLASRIEKLQNELSQIQPRAFGGRTRRIDELDETKTTSLKKSYGQGTNPAGTKRGYRDDPGAVDRMGNLSKGAYTWWTNKSGEDVLTYNPGISGRFRLWLSWGVHGSGVHTRDARYVLDRDGDLTTRGDQRELASVDQYHFAGVTEGKTELAPLWSGLRDVGVVDLTKASKVILRSGETGTGITADVIVLQEDVKPTHPKSAAPADAVASALPHFRVPVNPARNVEHFDAIKAKFVRFTIVGTNENNRYEPCLDELEIFAQGESNRNVALASAGGVATSSGNYKDVGVHELRHINDGKFGNSKSWISSERGGGWVQVELKEVAAIDRVEWGRDRSGRYKDRLPVRYQIQVSLDGKSWTRVASNEDRLEVGMPHNKSDLLVRNSPADGKFDPTATAAELARLEKQKSELEKPQLVYGGVFRKPDKTFLLRRGDPEQPIDEVAPAVPVVFSKKPLAPNLSEQGRRKVLANWIASRDHPLTARVIVNRIWQHHFGIGLVETANDFGHNGTSPSHPKLLDWLASELVEHNWSIKHIQRLISLSATYRQSSNFSRVAAEIDADSRLLWRYPPRRMEAEAIRDSMLLVTGELNFKMGGPGFNFFKTRGGLSGFPPVDKFGKEEFRRMVYAHKVRMETVPIFGAFDCPDAGQSASRRTRSTTAIQALNLFNSSYVLERSKVLSERVKKASSDDPKAQVSAVFELVLGRLPTEIESSVAIGIASEHGLIPLCRALFNSNEFLFIP